MGLDFLWDTNSVIYYLQEQFSTEAAQVMDKVVKDNNPTISIVTEIEALSWRSASEADLLLMNNFMGDCVIYQLDEQVKLKAISIRRALNLKLPDAIIAATALVYDKVLITRNISDFKKVHSLKILNPFEIL